jgi:glutathione S-transferase
MSVLYGINLSTFTRKVRLALAEKGIGYRLEPAPMGSPKVRELNPLGRIPVYEADGVAIPDSTVIIAYLERVYPDKALYPADPKLYARALWLEEYADTRLREATVPFFAERVVKPLFQGRPADDIALEKAALLRDECFDYLENQLGEAPFAAGAGFTVADIAIGAQLITYRQGGGEIDAARWPKLAGYLKRLLERPAWMALVAEETESLRAARIKRGI